MIREKYHKKLKLYKRTCNNKRYKYWQNKFDCIESALNDPKIFWKTWKNCSEKQEPNKLPDIGGERWFNHFSNLHAKNFENSLPPSVPKELHVLLNNSFTKEELLNAIKKLKNGKSSGYDKISNEMIKNAPNQVLDLLLVFINLFLDKFVISKSHCYDIIQPIFKSEDKSDPNNYRGYAYLRLF